jgi:hypothetical protein
VIEAALPGGLFSIRKSVTNPRLDLRYSRHLGLAAKLPARLSLSES